MTPEFRLRTHVSKELTLERCESLASTNSGRNRVPVTKRGHAEGSLERRRTTKRHGEIETRGTDARAPVPNP